MTDSGPRVVGVEQKKEVNDCIVEVKETNKRSRITQIHSTSTLRVVVKLKTTLTRIDNPQSSIHIDNPQNSIHRQTARELLH